MKREFVLSVFTAAILVASCKSGGQIGEADGVHTVFVEPLVGSEQVVRLSEVASKVEYIPLETSQESLLGNVMHAFIDNDIIYLPDIRVNKLSRYSLDGKYLGSVGQQGRAYGEFISINGFCFDYDYDTGAEMIYDSEKLIEYHKDGSVKVIKLDRISDKTFNVDFIKKIGGIYLCAISRFGTGISDLVFLDSDGQLMGEFPAGYESGEYKEQKIENVKQEGMIFSAIASRSYTFPYRFGNKLMVTNLATDTIFAYNPNETIAQPVYVINYGQYSDLSSKLNDESIKIVSTFTRESKKHLFLTFNFGKYRSAENREKLTRVLFDKTTGEARSLKGRLENDIDGGPSFWPLRVSPDGQMVAIIQAIDFIDAAKESNSAKMKEIAAKLTDESNPVIMLVTN